MRFLKMLGLILLIIILLSGCNIFGPYYPQYEHLPKYVLKKGKITIDKDIYVLSEWDYPKFLTSENKAEVIARVDDRDRENRYNGLLYALHQFSDRSFLIYMYEADPGSGMGGYRVLRRSDIDMPEMTFENVDSLESDNFFWSSKDATLIHELFVALSDEANKLENNEYFDESEHYDTIICRNDDWPDFCFSIPIRRHEGKYYVWSKFLGKNRAWITMPQDLIEEIIGKAN